jgi:hypothetical protein
MDPQKALENAKDAFVVTQMRNKVFQKIDLQTLKSYSVNKTYPREWYDDEYKLSIVSEGLKMDMNQKEVIKTLGKDYHEVSYGEFNENVWRYDIKGL